MMKDIGAAIKAARESAGLTQGQLGEKIGVSGVAVMRYEKNQRKLSVEQLAGIAEALNTTVYEMVGPEYMGTVDWKQVQFSYSIEKDLLFQLESEFETLNAEGQKVALERIKELAEIPRYQK